MNRPHLDLAVIVISYNTRELLHACLRSVYAAIAQADFKTQVWVVDNASSDGSPDMVHTQFPQTRLLVLEHNVGFASGNNAALRELGFGLDHGLQPDLVFFLNPDTEMRGNALEKMAKGLSTVKNAGVVGASLIFPDGRFQHSAFHFPTLWQICFDFFQNIIINSFFTQHQPGNTFCEAGASAF